MLRATWRGLETWHGRDASANWRASPRPYRGDGVEQPSTMAYRHHADLPEILGRQAGQHPFVDLVGAERRLVLLEPETAEPCRNVHARLPDRSMPRSHRTSNCRCARILDGSWCGSGLRHGGANIPRIRNTGATAR